MLSAHNFYRTEHNASALAWNATSATYAQNWANGCEFHHTVRLPLLPIPGALARDIPLKFHVP